jgi:hypothetical protein
MGAEVRCAKCGRDFRARGDGEGASRVLSATPDDLDALPYSQRSVEIPVNSVSSLIVADPALLQDRFLRDVPVRENAHWLGKVRLLQKLGQGGMGSVYHGFDESLALDVAVKILPVPTGARDDQFVERFRQEARISARINHPNVVRTLHVDEEGDLVYLVMDYVPGQTARQLVDAKGTLACPLALQIIHDASLGMQAAHAHGIVHRDIKPDNILIADDGRVLLSDLGLAKAISTGGGSPRMPVTRLGLLLGTPEYMSPEQWEIGALIGPAADIWAMGATLWMLLTGKPPFEEKDTGLLARMVRELALPDIRVLRPDLPDCVLDILELCLSKQPTERFADAAGLLAALDGALQDLAAGRVAITPRVQRRSISPGRLKPVAPEPAPAPAAKPVVAAPAPPAAPARRPLPPFVRRLALASAATVAGFGGVALYAHFTRPVQPAAVVRPAVWLDVSCPTQVKPGQEAECTARVQGGNPAEYAIVWTAGPRVFPRGDLRMPFDCDAEFTVVARDRLTGREVARRDIKIAVELQVRAAEKEFHEIVAGASLPLAGTVRGGAGAESIETRWVELSAPEKPLASGAAFDPSAVETFREPGRYTFAFQARRKGAADWDHAATDKVVVQVLRRVPDEFKTAVQEGAQAREQARRAPTGADALAHWKRALAAFEKATAVWTDEEAKLNTEQCRQRVALEEKYLGLLDEARRLQDAAAAVPESDGLRRLAAWSEALRPCSTALVLFDRDEARALSAAAEARVKELKAKLESAEDERSTFDRLIGKARHSAKEAAKYVRPGDALPHWEDALAGFTELRKRFPKRAEEFALELKQVQEHRDRAYLQQNMGIVPGRNGENGTAPPPPEKKDAAPKTTAPGK